MTDLRQTPLCTLQEQRGGRMVSFAGWRMAVQFEGVVAEHQAVRERVGLFDVSHMGELLVEGPGAQAAVQHVITNDVAALPPGRALYTVMCTQDGGIVDDLIVYAENSERYFVCVNASRREDDFAHMRQHMARFRCKVTDVSDAWSQLALQGPLAAKVLAKLTRHDVAAMPAFCWADATVADIDSVRIARTGYTGEHGYELYCPAGRAAHLWEAIEKAGAPEGLALCGLGARDTLRLEMKYPLYGNDIDLQHNPLEAGLAWVVKFKKGPFLGSEALAAVKAAGPPRRWVGFRMVERGIPRQGYAIHADGAAVGEVTSGTHSPTLQYAIGCGYVPAGLAAPGTSLQILIRDKLVAATVVATPFLKRENT